MLKFQMIKKQLLYSLLYAISISFIFLLSDKLFSIYNNYFLFEITYKELLNKMGIVILFISAIKSSKIRFTFLSVIVLISFIQYVHFNYFGKNVSAIEFYLFATNLGETFEALNGMLETLLFPIFISFLTLFSIYMIDKKINEKVFKFKYIIHIMIIFFIFFYSQMFYLTNIKKDKLSQKQSTIIYPMTNRHSARNYFVSLNYYIAGILPKKLFFAQTTYDQLSKPKKLIDIPKRTVVLIIGESLRYDKFKLTDNKLTPRLQSLKNDENFYFKKVYSGGTMTKVSVATLINRLKYPNSLEQISKEDNCLFKLAKDNNFSTSFISAQNNHHLRMIRDMMCPKYINNYLSRDDFSQYISQTGYDEDLESILKNTQNYTNNNFIVLQQRGSHVPYSQQYPKQFKKYSPYDNTSLYTDTTLFNIINYFKKIKDKEFYLFFVSDHGELLGEQGMNGHGHLHQKVYEVPFLMYTNSKDKDVKNYVNNIKSHFDISNYIAYLLGYDIDFKGTENNVTYILNSDLEGFSGIKKISR